MTQQVVIDEIRKLRDERDELERQVQTLRDALAHYADHRNWGIRRDDMHRYPAAVWIGPGAVETVPDAPRIAREALS